MNKYLSHTSAFIQLLRHRMFNKKVPFFTALGVTCRCNYRCVYCYGDYYNQKQENFSTEELLETIDILKDMGTQVINLIGGEPLLRDDIGLLVNRVKEYGMVCHLSSNASLLKEKIELVKNIDALDTSLDGLEENNDKNRGEGTFLKTLEGIRCAIEHKIKTNVNVVLTKYNVSDIDELVKLAIEEGFLLSFNLVFESHSCEHVNYQDSIDIKSKDDSILRSALRKIIVYKQKGYPIRFSKFAYS